MTVTKITDAQYPTTTVRGIAYLDGTYYVMNPNGQIFGSDLTVQHPGTAPHYDCSPNGA